MMAADLIAPVCQATIRCKSSFVVSLGQKILIERCAKDQLHVKPEHQSQCRF